MTDPSWSELKHFVDFLNSQLQDSEESTYCKPENVDDWWMRGTLAGFTSFVINFMVTMSRVGVHSLLLSHKIINVIIYLEVDDCSYFRTSLHPPSVITSLPVLQGSLKRKMTPISGHCNYDDGGKAGTKTNLRLPPFKVIP